MTEQQKSQPNLQPQLSNNKLESSPQANDQLRQSMDKVPSPQQVQSPVAQSQKSLAEPLKQQESKDKNAISPQRSGDGAALQNSNTKPITQASQQNIQPAPSQQVSGQLQANQSLKSDKFPPNNASQSNVRQSLDAAQRQQTNNRQGTLNQMQDIEEDEEEKDRKLRASQLKGPYATRDLTDPREAMRVKSLQLLCFKLATHKEAIQQVLDSYSTIASPQKEQIAITDYRAMMNDLIRVVGFVFMTYDQYISGVVIKQHSPEALKRFEEYLVEKLISQGDGLLRTQTQLEKLQVKKVTHEQIAEASKAGAKLSFTDDFFLYHIDKFFNQEQSVVIHALDDEFDKFMATQKNQDDEFQRQIEDLDDYVFNQEDLPVQTEEDNGSLVKKQLERTIKEFESTLHENKFSTLEERSELETLVKTLKKKLQNLDKGTPAQTASISPNKKQLSIAPSHSLDVNELRKRGLQEIFDFYSRQHIPQNRKFDELMESMTEIDLGEYMKFCKDFQIPLTKAKIQEIFKKCSNGHRPHKMEQFTNSLTRLGLEINKQKIQEIEQKLKSLGNASQMRSNRRGGAKQGNSAYDDGARGESQMDGGYNNYDGQASRNNDANGSQLTVNQRQSIINDDDVNQYRNESQLMTDNNQERQYQDERSVDNGAEPSAEQLLAMKEELENKTEDECREDMLQYLECHDQNKYRKKIKGFHIAFNIREKVLRVGPEELSKYKFQSKLSPEEIRRLANEAKQKRVQDKINREKEEKEKYQKEREALRKMHEQIRRDKGLMTGKRMENDGKGYQQIGAKSGDEKHLKITFAVIEKMHYSDFNSGNDAEDFKPSDIIDEEDVNVSDDEVLKKFKNDINYNKLNDYDQRTLANGLSKNNLDGGAIPSLGLRQQKVASPRVNNQKSSKPQNSNGSEAAYLIDPLQEKIHTLKYQLQQQIGHQNPPTNRAAGLQNQNSKKVMGEPVLSQKNLANHNQQLQMALKNPATHRADMLQQTPNLNLGEVRSAKKRGGASTDMVPSKQKGKQPLTDIRNYEGSQQYELSPQRNQKMPSMNRGNQYGSVVAPPGQGMMQNQKNLQNNNISQSLDTQNFRQQQGRAQGAQNAQPVPNLQGLTKDSIAMPISYNARQNYLAQQSNANVYPQQYQQQQQRSGPQGVGAYQIGQRGPVPNDLSAKEQMMTRAAQIQQQAKRQEERNMNGIMKMHDLQIKKGLQAVKK
ncbi:hypothetical protein FGO68_gene11624 [Halteria grandinella]|uniref:Uncharacterized protein n=1 Tax=Halteria grandinella TaxID=5974 RepID=A0A8J8P6G5_HALGN|nr:hypothetical protein FGO68_gene11624 [Halteria grandinella]